MNYYYLIWFRIDNWYNYHRYNYALIVYIPNVCDSVHELMSCLKLTNELLLSYLILYRQLVQLSQVQLCTINLANIYLFKIHNRSTRKKHEIRSKLTTTTPEQCQWRRSGVFNVDLEHISHLFLVFLSLTSNK